MTEQPQQPQQPQPSSQPEDTSAVVDVTEATSAEPVAAPPVRKPRKSERRRWLR
jgi:hypothetical protein